MKHEYKQRGNVFYATHEIFASGQTLEENMEDYKLLVKSLESCVAGNCSGCMLCGFSDTGDYSCDESLKKISARQFKILLNLE